MELDVEAIGCDYTEYSLDELKAAYSNLLEDEDENSENFLKNLRDEVALIDCENDYFLVWE